MSNSVQQMQQALIQQGMLASQLAGLSEEQLMKLCSEKLRASLVGNGSNSFGEGFFKNLKYDKEYKLPDGNNVMVSQIGTSTLPSGRKVEIFVDIAGNQYFQYRSADNKVLEENYFRKQEKLGLGQQFKFLNGKLYKSDFMGNLSVAEKETPKIKPVNQQLQEQKLRDDLDKKPMPKEDAITLSKQLKEKFASDRDGNLIRKLASAVDMGNYAAIPTIIENDFNYGLETTDAGTKRIVHDVLYNMGPNQIDSMIKWLVDDNNDENLSISEKIYNRIADCSKAADNMFVGIQGLVIAAFPSAVSMLPETVAGVVTAGVTAPVIADGIVNTVDGVSDLIDAETEEETSEATQKLATGVLEDAAGLGIARAVMPNSKINFDGLKTKAKTVKTQLNKVKYQYKRGQVQKRIAERERILKAQEDAKKLQIEINNFEKKGIQISDINISTYSYEKPKILFKYKNKTYVATINEAPLYDEFSIIKAFKDGNVEILEYKSNPYFGTPYATNSNGYIFTYPSIDFNKILK